MPIDINELRTYKGGDVEKWKEHQSKRYKSPELVENVIKLDSEWRDLTNLEAKLRRDVNRLQKEVIAPKKKAKENCDEEVQQMKDIQKEIKLIQSTKLPEVAKQRDALLNKVGNVVDAEVPFSKDEEKDSLVVELHPMPDDLTLPQATGSISYATPETKPLLHHDLLWRVDGYEPERGVSVAGARTYFLKDAGVLLNQALINYGIAFLRKRGYTILQPPYFMKKDVMAQLAQLEDFDEQLYKVSGKTDVAEESDKYLIATSEQPICGYHKDEWIQESSLPLRYCGISTCFRKEAGSSGKDIRGIFRVHQFDKIEQFCLTEDNYETSSNEQKRMLECATDFYKSLGFSYRVICLVSGELNDAAVKKYDLEAWFPGQQTYRELVSCSNCTDYQARAVGTRCGIKKASKDDANAKTSYCHMLNATLCATGRVICCLLETYQEENGVRIPEVLQPYMGGIDFLEFTRGPIEMSKGEKGAQKGKKK